MLPPLLEDGQAPRGWPGLGLKPLSIPAGWRTAVNLDAGLMIVSVVTLSPAGQAGMGLVLCLQRGGTPIGFPVLVAAESVA